MQRIAGLLALSLTAALLAGCAYDPYTGTYAPCCGYYGNPYYGNPYYRYPPPYAPYGYPSGPYMAQPPSQPGAYTSPPLQFAARAVCATAAGPAGGIRITTDTVATRALCATAAEPAGGYPPPPGQSQAEPDAAASPAGGVPARQFATIPATRDGRLTRDHAMADMPLVARSFGSM